MCIQLTVLKPTSYKSISNSLNYITAYIVAFCRSQNISHLFTGIAYATIAGLEPQYGLYSAFMGCFVYMVFGSCKDITIGPTAIMALMTGIHAQYGADYAILLAFLSGLIILACGLLKLGFLIDFISMPVIAGFTSAAAITIATSQVFKVKLKK